MDETLYIPYGTEEIDYNQLLQNMANDVQSFVSKQPWSGKRKQSFLNAYSDIVSKGITGASNNSGIWTINHKGSQIPLDSYSSIDKEMYGAAADYIQQQMAKLPTKASLQETERKKKEELPIFNNEYFTKNFHSDSHPPALRLQSPLFFAIFAWTDIYDHR